MRGAGGLDISLILIEGHFWPRREFMRDEQVFNQVLEQAVDQRAAFLDAACGTDVDLRERVAMLLRAQANPGSFLQYPACGVGNALTIDQPQLTMAGTQIGPYKLIEEIGQGGMGVVYMAEQKEPVRRRVALKIVKPGMDSRQVIARFDAERQALAIMDHPNIARIIDAGTTEQGRPYFVMELVHGIPINEFCDQERLTVRERLELFLQVCQAVQHAHQKGIIHRDLKPTNVLVTLLDVVAVPKVIDFGIAKAFGPQLTDQTQVTGFAQIVGTPLYMSPEQAEMNQLGVDTRSDVYSLGVMLYELLIGKTPFESEALRQAGPDEMRRMIREVEPPRPSVRISTLAAEALSTVSERRRVDPRKLSQQLRGELDWIVMKALEKDRNRRYETANALADDVQRYLDDLPVQASPPSYSYRVRKFVRRNQVVVVASGSLLLMMVMATVISTHFAWKANVGLVDSERERQAANSLRVIAEARQRESQRLEQEATASRDDTKRALYLADMRLADADLREANIVRVHRTLEGQIPVPNTDDHRGWEWYYLLGASNQHASMMAGHSSQVEDVCWSQDSKFIASTGYDGVRICDASSGELNYENYEGATIKRAGAWSPDSQRYAWGSAAGESVIRVWDSIANQVVVLKGHTNSLTQVAWSPDGSRLVSTSFDNTCRIWDYQKGECLFVIQDLLAVDVCWNSKCDLIATSGGNGAWIINADSGEIVTQVSQESAQCVEFSADGERLLVGYGRGRCSVHATDHWKILFEFQAHSNAIHDIDANPIFPTFATCGADGVINIWNLADGKKSLALYGHDAAVNGIDWDPSGRLLVTASTDRQVKTWDLTQSPNCHQISLGSAKACTITWDAQSSQLHCAADDGSISIIDVSTRKVHKPTSRGWLIDDDPEDREYTTSAIAKYLEDSARSEDTKLQQLFLKNGAGVVWSADGSKVAIIDQVEGGGKRISLWKIGDKAHLHQWVVIDCVDAKWAPDNKMLAVAGRGMNSDGGIQAHAGWVYAFDTSTGAMIQKMRHGNARESASAVAWNPKGTRIVSGNITGLACIWDARLGNRVNHRVVSQMRIASLAWSPDGQRIASADNQGQVKILESETLEELLTLRDGEGGVTQLAWSPDGRQLAGIDSVGHVIVWNASRGFDYANSEPFRKVTRRENTNDLVAQARNPFAKQDYESVIALLNQPLGDDEGNIEALFMRGIAYLETARFPEAIADLKRVTELHSKHQIAWNWLGVSQMELGQIDDAIDSLTAAYDAIPMSGDAPRANRAVAYILRGDVGTAESELQQISNKDPLNYASQILAVLHISRGQTEAYRTLCKRMLDHIRPDEKGFWVSEVQACWISALAPIALADSERLLSFATKWQRQIPDNQELNLNLGAALLRTGNAEQALDHLLIASKEEDRTRTPHRGLWTKKAESFRVVYAHYLLAITQHSLNQRELAKGTLDKANALAAKQPPSWRSQATMKLLQLEAMRVLQSE